MLQSERPEEEDEVELLDVEQYERYAYRGRNYKMGSDIKVKFILIDL